MILENRGQLRILTPDEGNVLFKKKDTDNREYFNKVYLAISETEEDYSEVSKDYAYGLSTDKEYLQLKENYGNVEKMLKLQSEIIDSILFPKTTINNKPLDSLSEYITMRINDGAIDYETAIKHYPELKSKIDAML